MTSIEKLQKLKTDLIELAVSGKLVEQRQEEGTAQELYEKIQQNKNRLIAEGKLKKEKSLPEISEDEIPFEIPKSWKWLRLVNLGLTQTGTTPPTLDKRFFGNDISFVKPGDIGVNNKVTYREDGLSFLGIKKSRKASKNSILMVCIGGSIGKCCIVEKDVCFNQQINSITTYCNINSKYVFYVLLSNYFQIELTKKYKGTATPIIKKALWELLMVPVPPIEEQKRIVESLEAKFKVIDKAIALLERKADLDKKIKEKILQLAIQGKLVEQKPKEGTAQELYEKIQQERQKLISEGKLKKEKLLPEISEDGIPFEIPKSWKWVQLKYICTKIVDGDHNPPKALDKPSEYIMISSLNINQDKLVKLDQVRYLDTNDFNKIDMRTSISKGDILLTIVGTLGRSCIYSGNLNNITCQRSVCVISTLINCCYLKRVFDSNYMQDFMLKNSSGTAQKGFYLKNVNTLTIPLPPLEEQQRIVAKIEQLFNIIDNQMVTQDN